VVGGSGVLESAPSDPAESPDPAVPIGYSNRLSSPFQHKSCPRESTTRRHDLRTSANVRPFTITPLIRGMIAEVRLPLKTEADPAQVVARLNQGLYETGTADQFIRVQSVWLQKGDCHNLGSGKVNWRLRNGIRWR
jgi:hypothetical protein